MKKMCVWLLMLALAMSMTACGGSAKETETSNETTEAATEEVLDDSAFDDYGNTQDCVDITTIDASSYVKLGAYTGFEIDMEMAEVSQDEIDNETNMLVQELSQKIDTGAGAEVEDYVDLSFALETSEGILDQDEEFQLYLGYNDLGEEVDAALMGAKPGDTLEVPVDVAALYGLDEGTEGHYTIGVLKVYRYEVPELNDELVAANTEYKTVAEYEDSIRASLQEESNRMNHYYAEEQAISLAMAEASFEGYPQELYDYVYNELKSLYEFYADIYGMTLEELMGEETLEEPVLTEVNTLLTVKAIAEEAKIELTDEAFEKYLAENCSDYGYEDPNELRTDMGDAYLRNYALRSLVGTYIMENSTVNELSESEYYEKYYSEDDEFYEEETYEEEEPLVYEEETFEEPEPLD